jgi:DNA-binding MarR family transcriptional regulator
MIGARLSLLPRKDEHRMVTIQEAAASCACLKARKAARAVTRAYDKVLRPSGLRSTQFSILGAAGVSGGVPLGKLAKMLGMERTTLTRNLQLIEREGLIKVIDIDGRTRNVVLTATGTRRLAQALPLWEEAQNALRRKLGARDWATIQGALTALAGIAL